MLRVAKTRLTLPVDGEAIDQLLRTTRHRVELHLERYRQGIEQGDSDWEDLAQVVLGRLWRHLGELRGHDLRSFERWVAVIVRHSVADRMRYLEVRRWRQTVSVEFSEVADVNRAPRIEDREDAARLRDALAALDRDSRRLVEAHFLEETDLRSLAAQEGLAHSTVWVRIDRALCELRRRLK